MDVAVLGRKQTAPDEVRALAQAKVAKLGRLTPVLERAEVRLSEDHDAPGSRRKVCEVTITGHGHTLRAKAAAPDVPVAVDKVVDKLEHQVERLKGKLLGAIAPPPFPLAPQGLTSPPGGVPGRLRSVAPPRLSRASGRPCAAERARPGGRLPAS